MLRGWIHTVTGGLHLTDGCNSLFGGIWQMQAFPASLKKHLRKQAAHQRRFRDATDR